MRQPAATPCACGRCRQRSRSASRDCGENDVAAKGRRWEAAGGFDQSSKLVRDFVPFVAEFLISSSRKSHPLQSRSLGLQPFEMELRGPALHPFDE